MGSMTTPQTAGTATNRECRIEAPRPARSLSRRLSATGDSDLYVPRGPRPVTALGHGFNRAAGRSERQTSAVSLSQVTCRVFALNVAPTIATSSRST